ncbi:MAG: elongation factor 1-beta [Candidatus Micrarchaeota archaeon]|nr:elongation factor 1-beta [Candidatus Micrarchaeota archaeon]
MAKVAVLFKVYTDEGQQEEVSKRIKEQLKPNGIAMEEIAFGIKIIKVQFVYEDEQGSTKLEDGLRKVAGVNEVEVIEETLL